MSEGSEGLKILLKNSPIAERSPKYGRSLKTYIFKNNLREAIIYEDYFLNGLAIHDIRLLYVHVNDMKGMQNF